MGCECQRVEDSFDEITASDKKFKKKKNSSVSTDEINNKNNNKIQPSIPVIDIYAEPEDNFSKYIFKQINKLRENPQSFINIIQNAKRNIIKLKGINVYKSSVKVALNNGESAFDDAIRILQKTEPMDKLIFNPKFVIDLPTNESELRSGDYLSSQANNKIESGIDIKSFWKDVVKDPVSCIILTIVDDSGRNAGKKRQDILNRNNKYIGISSKEIGKTFACYIVLG